MHYSANGRADRTLRRVLARVRGASGVLRVITTLIPLIRYMDRHKSAGGEDDLYRGMGKAPM